MSKILIVSVGGSSQPIVTSIKSLKPDRVIFFCSGGKNSSTRQVIGEGNPCEVRKHETVEKLPNILKQTGYEDKFNREKDLLVVENPDNLEESCMVLNSKITQLANENPGFKIIADYTGGTKTMSAALVKVALDIKIDLHLTTRDQRTNLVKVDKGESTRKTSLANIYYHDFIQSFLPGLIKEYNYSASAGEIQEILNEYSLQPDKQKKLSTILNFCRGFDAWDRFNHMEAFDYLQDYMNNEIIKPTVIFLKKIIFSRSLIDEKFNNKNGIRGHGFEIVEDLILNAERRASQGRFDDAVGRIYRAIELLAQLRLKTEYGINTGDIDITKLPEDLKEKYQQKANPTTKKIQLALNDSYHLLHELGDKPLGKSYIGRENLLRNTLLIRNNSLFAHGFAPISENEYSKMETNVISFIKEKIEEIAGKKHNQPVQFPEHFI